MVRIRIYDGEDKFLDVDLEGECLTVGRDPSSDIVLPDVSVSRHHASIERAGNFYLLRDQASTNGTYVNDMLVQVQLLSHGDVIRTGKYVMRVESRRTTDRESTRVRLEDLDLPLRRAPTGRVREPRPLPAMAPPEDPRNTSIEWFTRLGEIHTEIGYIHGEADLLDRCLEIILSEIRADRGCFLLPEADAGERPPSGRLQARSVLSRLRDAGDPDEIVIPDGLLASVMDDRGAVISSPGQALPGIAMAAPLLERESLRGVVYIDRVQSKTPFTDDDRHCLAAIADQVTISLANARLFEAVQAEKDKVQAIFTCLTDGVLVADENFRVTDVNIAATVLLDLTGANPIGRNVFDLFGNFVISPSREVLEEEAWKSGAVFHVVSRDAEGSAVKSLTGQFCPFASGDKERRRRRDKGVAVTLRDMSQFHRLEQLKNQFVSNVAHKLRTPLTVIEGNLPLLRQAGDSSEEAGQILRDIEGSSHHLCELVNKFLEFSEIELRYAGQADVPAPCVVKGLVDQVFDEKADAARQRGLKLVNDVPDGLPRAVIRRGRFVEVVHRIVDNSLKFSGSGCRVTVEAEAGDGYLKLHFIDDGPGIPTAEVETVFFVGHQVDLQNTGQIPGAGLGLTIARHLMQQNGGDIRVTSPFRFLDHGTRVTLVLPLRAGKGLARAGIERDEWLDRFEEVTHGG